MNESGKCILIADSDAHFRSTLGFELKSYGFRVSMASSGTKAFELFPKMAFDVIIADSAMSNGNAFEIQEALKKIRREIPIIVTSTDQVLDPAIVLKAGMLEFMPKPMVPREVIEKIRKITGIHDSFNYFLNPRRTLVVVTWIGELRARDRESMEQCALETVKSDAKYIILNLHGLTGYDAVLAGEIVGFQERVRKMSPHFFLCGLDSQLRERMAANGLVNESEIKPSLKEALQYILEMGSK